MSAAPTKMNPVRVTSAKRDTEQQHLLLRETRHPEAADDDQKYEQVVDRQGFVGQVAGEIFDRQL